MDILKPFDKVTKRLEGHATQGTYGSLWEVLPCMEYIFEHLHKIKRELQAVSTRRCLLHAVELAIIKLERYYAKTDENVAVVGALVMNPTIKWSYLKRRWIGLEEREWLRSAQDKVLVLWKTYKDENLPIGEPDSTDETYDHTSIDSFMLPPPPFIDVEDESVDDEYQRYCRSPVVCTDNIVKWWAGHTREYPRLSRMAMDLLSIPATETE